jgi:hypothetical protein
LNAKTARSRAIGGMTFGVGAALMEAIVVDKRDGWFVNNNHAEYHVAANADIPAIDAVFLPETDDRSSAMKSKGLGELGICGRRRGGGERRLQRDQHPHPLLPANAGQGANTAGICTTCHNPASARAANHTLMTGPNSMPIRALPRLCIANNPTSTTTVSGTT